MFEHKTKPLANKHVFYRRMFVFWMLGTSLIIFSLILGTLGYMYFGNVGAVDGFYNASMILAGMGPALEKPCDAVKIFSSFYALYCGIVFLSSITIAFAPIIHRFFHIIHLEGK
ncbi:MAG: hypothetical protein IPO78_08485 [Saprospiraceae bacterium]|nr:hypothetical protein [Saprospiraceae bacterium]MBK8449932.1 hypothetical protein [Saprospiraceae bacterium]MBK9221416.1 hypothetical protein [Saprospiraceae bacterium]MBK9721646.1 hypothetical protein [Saprospiraceae bacterium]